MTEQEALALKPGDRVEAYYYDTGLRVAVVVRVYIVEERDYATVRGIRGLYDGCKVGDFYSCRVRPLGRTARGGAYPSTIRFADELRRSHDPIAANVYADWLEESGYLEAAAALRKRFPLATGD